MKTLWRLIRQGYQVKIIPREDTLKIALYLISPEISDTYSACIEDAFNLKFAKDDSDQTLESTLDQRLEFLEQYIEKQRKEKQNGNNDRIKAEQEKNPGREGHRGDPGFEGT